MYRTERLKAVGTKFLVGAYEAWNGAGLPAVTAYVRSVPGVAPEKSTVPHLVRDPRVRLLPNADLQRAASCGGWAAAAVLTEPAGLSGPALAAEGR